MYKVKFQDNGQVKKNKFRLIVKGYNQKEGRDYQDTFSPIVKIVTLWSVLSIVVTSSWHIHKIGVYNVFLQGDLFDEMYTSLTEEFSSWMGVSRADL